MRFIHRIAAALAAVLVLSCAASGQAAQLKQGQPFPSLVFPDLDGEPKSIADFTGKKTILHIYASW